MQFETLKGFQIGSLALCFRNLLAMVFFLIPFLTRSLPLFSYFEHWKLDLNLRNFGRSLVLKRLNLSFYIHYIWHRRRAIPT